MAFISLPPFFKTGPKPAKAFGTSAKFVMRHEIWGRHQLDFSPDMA